MVSKHSWVDYLYIVGTVVFTVYGQIVVKWQVTKLGPMTGDAVAKVRFLLDLVRNPFILSSLACAFLAFLCWVGAMTKFDLSYAYPFTALSFVAVLFLSAWAFREPITMAKATGVLLVVLGLVVGSRR